MLIGFGEFDLVIYFLLLDQGGKYDYMNNFSFGLILIF